ncbi:hypothetical protein AAAC05_07280 [Pseudomonas aeruginosa]|uniref:hypothetical protein n=1 Tax=Pseudomonas aeruginosa TaxID=287 RepID=UPI0030EFFCD9
MTKKSCFSGGWQMAGASPIPRPILRVSGRLKKAASDARRLRTALGRLDAKDAASLDFNYSQSIPLSTRLYALEELANDADALGRVIKGEQADIVRLRKRRTAKSIANTLSMFGIPLSTRNDWDVDERNVTTAMRCVMFAMLEADAKKLHWGTAAAIVKLGLQMLTDPDEEKVVFSEGKLPVTAGDAENFRLFLREMPEFNGIKLVE